MILCAEASAFVVFILLVWFLLVATIPSSLIELRAELGRMLAAVVFAEIVKSAFKLPAYSIICARVIRLCPVWLAEIQRKTLAFHVSLFV